MRHRLDAAMARLAEAQVKTEHMLVRYSYDQLCCDRLGHRLVL